MEDFEELIEKTTVVNMRFFKNVNCVNVMRGTRFGNPFKITKTRTRGDVLRDFIKYFKRSKSLQRRVREELEGKRLGCCCHPQPCHANVYALWLNGYSWEYIINWARLIP